MGTGGIYEMDDAREHIGIMEYDGTVIWKPSRELIESMCIEAYMDKIVDHRMEIHANYRKLHEVFSGDVPDDIIRRFKLNPYRDYILENLQTHDNRDLVNGLASAFPEAVIDVGMGYGYGTKAFLAHGDRFGGKAPNKCAVQVTVGFEDDDVDMKAAEETVRRVADFYGYSVSRIVSSSYGGRVMGHSVSSYVFASLEPIYAESAGDFVYGKCRGILYHITSVENADNILKKGLRIKTGGSGKVKYREFPKRVYMLGFGDVGGDIEEPLYTETFKDALNTYIHPNVRLYGFSVIAVDVNGLNYDFYEDSIAKANLDPGYPVYCYNSIPPSAMTEVFRGDRNSFEEKYGEF